MTIVYEGSFLRALFRWRGSAWKAVWRELLIWIALYYLIRILLTHACPDHYQRSIHAVVKTFDMYTTRLPLEFLLGFYVSQTVSRWWAQVHGLKSPQDLMATICVFIHGTDEDSIRTRRIISRYLLLAQCLAYRQISSRIKELYPTNEPFVKAGVLTVEEQIILESAPNQKADYEVPLQWAAEITRQKVGCHTEILRGFSQIRLSIISLMRYNGFSLPLVYTQTVTIAVYGYFMFCLIGQQFVHQTGAVDTGVPFLIIFRFIFGVGWLKVAQDLAKPFGDDDDDLDLCTFLSHYADVLVVIAEYAPLRRPLQSWVSDNNSAYEKMKKALDSNVLRYESRGKIFAAKVKKLVAMKNRSV